MNKDRQAWICNASRGKTDLNLTFETKDRLIFFKVTFCYKIWLQEKNRLKDDKTHRSQCKISSCNKKLTCKGTLRQVFSRVYRLEIFYRSIFLKDVLHCLLWVLSFYGTDEFKDRKKLTLQNSFVKNFWNAFNTRLLTTYNT